MRRRIGIVVCGLGLAVALGSTAAAQTLSDPALLFVSNIGTAPTGTDPNVIPVGSNGVRLSYWSDGSGHGALIDPVLLIIATPGSFSGAATGATMTGSGNVNGTACASYLTCGPQITATAGPNVVTLKDLGSTADVYGGTWNTTTGFAGNYTTSTGTDAYSFM